MIYSFFRRKIRFLSLCITGFFILGIFYIYFFRSFDTIASIAPSEIKAYVHSSGNDFQATPFFFYEVFQHEGYGNKEIASFFKLLASVGGERSFVVDKNHDWIIYQRSDQTNELHRIVESLGAGNQKQQPEQYQSIQIFSTPSFFGPSSRQTAFQYAVFSDKMLVFSSSIESMKKAIDAYKGGASAFSFWEQLYARFFLGKNLLYAYIWNFDFDGILWSNQAEDSKKPPILVLNNKENHMEWEISLPGMPFPDFSHFFSAQKIPSLLIPDNIDIAYFGPFSRFFSRSESFQCQGIECVFPSRDSNGLLIGRYDESKSLSFTYVLNNENVQNELEQQLKNAIKTYFFQKYPSFQAINLIDQALAYELVQNNSVEETEITIENERFTKIFSKNHESDALYFGFIDSKIAFSNNQKLLEDTVRSFHKGENNHYSLHFETCRLGATNQLFYANDMALQSLSFFMQKKAAFGFMENSGKIKGCFY